ncbi:MAG: arylesterase [Betaproteobacteria bacterium]|nr:MAG: arylesterase [Betaproteobacteria bacterium]TMG79663.1 MAG: arylesterase [Betaproteobacteria bacterium]
MSRLRRAIVLVLALAAACGGQPRLARLAPDAVVLAFGDSLTFGIGANPQESYPAQLEALIGRKVVASGVPGEVSTEGLARLSSAIDEAKPQLVILCHGGNDLLRKLDDAQAANNIRAMVRLAKARGAQVVLIGVPRPGLLPSAAGFYEDIARELGVPYEGTALRKILTDNALKSDLVHPNAAGYARLAEAVAALLKKAGAV